MNKPAALRLLTDDEATASDSFPTDHIYYCYTAKKKFFYKLQKFFKSNLSDSIFPHKNKH